MNKIDVYNNIIYSAIPRGLDKTKLNFITEKHHIIPKCIGGSNNKHNYVLLTPREHYICHLLLADILLDHRGLSLAAHKMMISNGVKIKSSKLLNEIVQRANEYRSIINSGSNHPRWGKHNTPEHNAILSKVNSYKRSDETKRRMSEAQLGKRASLETKEKLSKSHIGLVIHTEEHKNNLKERWTGGKNPRARVVIDPLGREFDSIIECAKNNNINYNTLRKWLRGGGNNPGYRYKN